MNARPGMMCVELAPDEAERQFRAQAFPYLLGLGKSRGWRVSWHALGVRYDPTMRYALGERDLGLLLAEARRRRPRVIVFSERVGDAQMAAIAAAAGGARGVYCRLEEKWIQDFPDFVRWDIPELGGPPSREWLSELAPVFKRSILNDAPWAARPLLQVVAGARCSYRTRVADNPFYRRLGLPSKAMPCSFCGVEPWPENQVGDPVAFAVRQISAACRQLPDSAVERRFDLIGHGLWCRLEELVSALSRAGVRRAELCFMPRIDEILDARESILRCLPLLADGGLAMRLYGAGVENFSADENLRLNKGVSAGQVHEAAAFIMETRARRPEQFRFKDGQLSMILFTPWTTFEDLRVNAENIARCPLICPVAALHSRLQLFAGHPITLLAERDGLVELGRKDSFYNSGCISDADQSEIPWRFSHPEVELLCRLGLKTARYYRGDRPAGDPEAAALGAFLEGPPDPLPFFRRALEALARRPQTGSLMELLRLVRSEGGPGAADHKEKR